VMKSIRVSAMNASRRNPSNKYVPFWRRSRLRSFAYALVVFPVYLLSRLIPKSDLQLFGSFNGQDMGDNSLAAFRSSDYSRKFFITKNRKLIPKVSPGENSIVWAYGVRGIALQLRASKVYYSHTVNDFVSPLIVGSVVVALRHGIPIKVNGANDPNLAWTRRPLVKWTILHFVPYLYHYYCNEVASPHEKFDSPILDIYGYSEPRILRVPMLRSLGLTPKSESTGVVLFAPTFRRNQSFETTLRRAGLFDPKLQTFLVNKKLKIHIKPHYLDLQDAITINYPEHISLLPQIELMGKLADFDLVVTDYSSIFYDAQVLNVPFSFINHDLEEFRSRESDLLAWFLELNATLGAQNLLSAISFLELHKFTRQRKQ
jgi:CDP-glycerol glycerophosphotransferase (TagB/SpsB family)